MAHPAFLGALVFGFTCITWGYLKVLVVTFVLVCMMPVCAFVYLSVM